MLHLFACQFCYVWSIQKSVQLRSWLAMKFIRVILPSLQLGEIGVGAEEVYKLCEIERKRGEIGYSQGWNIQEELSEEVVCEQGPLKCAGLGQEGREGLWEEGTV